MLITLLNAFGTIASSYPYNYLLYGLIFMMAFAFIVKIFK